VSSYLTTKKNQLKLSQAGLWILKMCI